MVGTVLISSHVETENSLGCDVFIELGGLKVIFAAFMGKVTSNVAPL